VLPIPFFYKKSKLESLVASCSEIKFGAKENKDSGFIPSDFSNVNVVLNRQNKSKLPVAKQATRSLPGISIIPAILSND